MPRRNCSRKDGSPFNSDSEEIIHSQTAKIKPRLTEPVWQDTEVR